MSATTAQGRAEERHLEHHVSGTAAFGWWGMVGLIATESMLFGSLVASYFYLRYTAGPVWPPDGIARPSLELPLVMTAILWSSSIPVHLADRAIRRGDQRVTKIGLALGFALGAVFLGLQVGLEYPETLQEFTPTTDAYGSLFYGLTGLHGSHVAAGLLFSLWTQVRAWRGAFDEKRHLSLQNFAMYWHFVDMVWAVVLFTIYLSPHL
ncbi:MAG: heme-copper oxidase subunit III [Actinomycetota bacterium]